MHKSADGIAMPETIAQKDGAGSSSRLTGNFEIACSAVMEGLVHTRTNDKTVTFDHSKYEALLADSTLSPADKRAVIEALWAIITGFVELGFGMHPVQLAMEDQKMAAKKPYGQPRLKPNQRPGSTFPVIELDSTTTTARKEPS